MNSISDLKYEGKSFMSYNLKNALLIGFFISILPSLINFAFEGQIALFQIINLLSKPNNMLYASRNLAQATSEPKLLFNAISLFISCFFVLPVSVGAFKYFNSVHSTRNAPVTNEFQENNSTLSNPARFKEVFFVYGKCLARVIGTTLWSSLWLFIWTLPGLGVMLFSSILFKTAFSFLGIFIGVIVVFGCFINRILAYSMTSYILASEPDLTYAEVLKASINLMDGSKADFFMLQLSFIGWYILEILTFGLLSLYVTPYRLATQTAFFLNIQFKLEKDTQKYEKPPLSSDSSLPYSWDNNPNDSTD